MRNKRAVYLPIWVVPQEAEFSAPVPVYEKQGQELFLLLLPKGGDADVGRLVAKANIFEMQPQKQNLQEDSYDEINIEKSCRA